MRLLLILVAAGAVAVLALATAKGSWFAAGTPRPQVIVAFGDSITSGLGLRGATVWTDVLARRLEASAPGRRVSVVNRGISGNRLLRDTMGPAGLGRFDGDVLRQPGVSWITVLIGINDLGFAGAAEPDDPPVTAAQLIDGYQQLVRKARARGVAIYGCTLLPFEGAAGGYYTPEKEAVRAAVNAWIRTPGSFDGVIDFDRLMRDPSRPGRLLPAYDSGDHLHPSDRGQQTMGDAVDLELFRLRE